MKKIVLTGGGTAGHVTPNIALFDSLKDSGYKLHYIGSVNGMEKELIERCKVPYYGISSGKMRRYLDIKNISDCFRVVKGFGQAVKILKKIEPDVVFSKGGFVIVPVVLAAKLLNIPVVIHESDITPGLANKISLPFAKAICASFPETAQHLNNKKVILTGTPIRKALFAGDAKTGRRICGFDGTKPVILVMGGSQGSVKINTVLRTALHTLLKSYHVAHICGKDNIDETLKGREGYTQFGYVTDDLPHIIGLADVIVSRAGANSIFEFLALRKPNLLIPLSKMASRGDQILNAESFEKQGFSKVLYEDNLTENNFVLDIIDLYSTRDKYINTMEKSNLANGVAEVVKIIKKYSK